MFVNADQKKLAIYIAEREVCSSKPDDKWFHCNLMLVDQTGERLAVVQQLHYSDVDEYFYPMTLKGLSTRAYLNPPEIYVLPVIDGNEIDILNLWNKLLAHACLLKDMHVAFGQDIKDDPYSNNCRTGVIRALQSIGINFQPDMYKSQAGTLATDVSGSPIEEQCHVNLSEAYKRNATLTKSLDSGSVVGERHTAEIRSYFSSIRGNRVYGFT